VYVSRKRWRISGIESSPTKDDLPIQYARSYILYCPHIVWSTKNVTREPVMDMWSFLQNREHRAAGCFLLSGICAVTSAFLLHTGQLFQRCAHFFYRATLCVSAMFAVVRWPSVCLFVCASVGHVGDCIHTVEDIFKHLVRPGSPIMRRYPIPREPLQRRR